MTGSRYYALRFSGTLAALFLALFAASCSEDDISTPAEDHFEAVGVQLSIGGNEIASVLRGETNDTLFVVDGDTTDVITVRFYDEDEEVVAGPIDAGMALAWIFGNAALCEVIPGVAAYEIRLRGLAEGLTTIEFLLNHQGHADFRSGNLPLRVMPGDGR